MKFEKLKNSLEINSNEKPSIYLALCLVETLFMDFKKEAGEDISALDIGDDTLPVKLTLIYRYLNKIYNNNSDSFERGKKNLDDMVVKSSEIQAQLEALNGEIGDLDGLVSDFEEKQRVLNATLKKKDEYERITEDLKRIESELCELGSYDIDALKDKLNIKTSELEMLGSGVKSTSDKLKQTEAEIAEQKSKMKAMEMSFETKRDELASLTEMNAGIQKELDSYPERKQKLMDEMLLKRAHLSDLEREIDEYSRRETLPVQEQIKLAEDKLKAAREEVENKSAEIKDVEARYAQLVLTLETKKKDLLNLTAQCDEKNIMFNEKTEEYTQIKSKWETLNCEYNELIAKISTSQDESEDLAKNKIPEAQKKLCDEQNDSNSLAQKLTETQKQLDLLIVENDRLQKEIEPLEVEVERLTVQKFGLTADYSQKSNQIEQLETELAELSGKTDNEKLNNYEIQLRKRIEEFEQVDSKCHELETTIDSYKEAIEKRREKQKHLEIQKEALEKANTDLQEIVNNLSYIDTPEVQKELSSATKKLEILKKASKKMLNHLQSIAIITGTQIDNLDNVEVVKKNIEKMHESIVKLSKELNGYSENVKLEVKE